MRAAAITIIAFSLIAAPAAEEPSEGAMQAAFAARLSDDVRNALDFVAETGGPDALRRIHAAGTHRFEISAFVKESCARLPDAEGHHCSFAVDIDTARGAERRALSGRFYRGPRGLAFAHAA